MYSIDPEQRLSYVYINNLQQIGLANWLNKKNNKTNLQLKPITLDKYIDYDIKFINIPKIYYSLQTF